MSEATKAIREPVPLPFFPSPFFFHENTAQQPAESRSRRAASRGPSPSALSSPPFSSFPFFLFPLSKTDKTAVRLLHKVIRPLQQSQHPVALYPLSPFPFFPPDEAEEALDIRYNRPGAGSKSPPRFPRFFYVHVPPPSPLFIPLISLLFFRRGKVDKLQGISTGSWLSSPFSFSSFFF